MLSKLAMSAAALVAAGFMGTAHAESSNGVKVGMLTCNVDSGWGLIFGSTRDLKCTFQSGRGTERYTGHISKFGVDIGYKQAGVIVWAVFAPSADVAPGALAGDFGGATASATVGVGAGANVLVGGFNRSISLQPVSFEGSTGLNVAAGIASLTLKASQ